jgi:hypothetical protein
MGGRLYRAHTTMIEGWGGRMPGPTACGVSPSVNAATRLSPSGYNLPEWQSDASRA